VVGRNKSLLTELAYTAATQPGAATQPADAQPADAQPDVREYPVQERDDHPVYRFWHGHISALISAQRPDADADMVAHLMLGALHSEPILAQLTTEGPERFTAAMRDLACAVLDAPARLRPSPP
jgi:hypothetical protein